MPGELPAETPLPARTDPALERFARLVRRQLDVPVALVTLVSADQQVFPGALGLPEPWQTTRATPLTHSFCQHVVTSERPLVIGDAREHPLVRDNLAIPDLGVVAYAGVPLVDAEGAVVGSLCAIDTRPRSWTDDDIAVLTDLAGACSSELKLRTMQERAETESTRVRALLTQHELDRARWSLALDAGRVGSFDWDLVAGEFSGDARLTEVLGLAGDAHPGVDAFVRLVHPDDAGRVEAAVRQALETCGRLELECRVVLAGGTGRWVQVRGRAMAGADGTAVRMVGAAYDTTEVRAGEVRTARVLEAMPSGFLTLDHAWRFTVLNGAAEALLGATRAELAGRTIWEAFPAAVGTPFEASCRTAVESGVPQTIEAFPTAPSDGSYEVLCWPGPDGLSLYVADVSARVLAARRAEAAGVRLALLARVNRDLVDALDVPRAVAGLPRLLVPALADGCMVTLLEEDGRPRDVGSWHADPDMRAVLTEYTATRLQSMPAGSPIARVLSTGEPVRSSAAEVDGLLPDGVTRRLLGGLDAADAVVIPVRGRGRVLGALSLFCGTGRDLDPDDVATGADIADRMGLALDNARLLTTQSQVAEGLQRSLLTEPPQPDHAQIVVRYVPATQSARVGGDWYDAFLQPSGHAMLVIGDVVGHDIAAAAAMGQLRGLLRGVAAYSDARPAEVLRGLDAAVRLLRVQTLATAAVARFEQTPEELARGLTRMVWASAGHPPPLVIAPDGRLEAPGPWKGDLLLGVDPDTRRTEHVRTLERGSTVLLYTDGLVERRDTDLDTGVQRLREAVTELAGSTLDELCDEVLARLAEGRNDDDVALVAVRLHPQDRPRPPEAGPRVVPAGLPAERTTRQSRSVQ